MLTRITSPSFFYPVLPPKSFFGYVLKSISSEDTKLTPYIRLTLNHMPINTYI